jgi:hypothetical protein
LAEGPWPAKAYFDAKRRAKARDAATYINYGFTRPAVFSEGPYQQFQNSDGTSGHMEGEPTEAMPENVAPPQPQQKMMPKGGGELPAPMTDRNGEAATSTRVSANSGRMNHAPSANYQSPAAPATPGMKSVVRPGSVKVSAIQDGQVQQAGYQPEKPFDWGDLPLTSSNTKTPVDNNLQPASAPSAAGWKPSGANESDPTQSSAGNDGPAASWKRAQR